MRRTDGRTDGHGDSSIPPPNFVVGGIKNAFLSKILNLETLTFSKDPLTGSRFSFPSSRILSDKFLSIPKS